ncbi:MAG: hypothetical protein ACO2ZK_12360, partial [Gemmobacter sp.]
RPEDLLALGGRAALLLGGRLLGPFEASAVADGSVDDPAAREFLGKVQQRVVLIDGQHLAGLLIRHRVGVRERERHAICTIDEDWFAED